MSEGFSLHITIHINPSDLPKFWEAFRPVYEKVIGEPECTFFEVYQSPEEPGTLSWVENWSKSKEWLLENQITKDYYRDYLAVTTPMFVKPREVKLLSRVASYNMVKRSNGGFHD
ncbi:hypothetical protein BO94DRAFT_524009 [Aspergillus sclerotioniger CBS 115572]|uniref:ABM domain-containing protein n=1 Tax=Aspergillus sclerotioniger CBS 115572 TaxID=1450535 RepID=A0A317VLF7_9EURO|nr:hypothetical protein BO94DRAFT_524009 [Aspergillus sclerotioniger CBS 115572]PWY75204.1 hypothetical protein BO94DRAFT_524009 [Aspergillus sclerotioniger CBS 115572]